MPRKRLIIPASELLEGDVMTTALGSRVVLSTRLTFERDSVWVDFTDGGFHRYLADVHVSIVREVENARRLFR